jgi:hypothetical protein
LIKTFTQYAKIRDRQLREDDSGPGSGVGPSLGSNAISGNASDAAAAFKDLSSSIETGMMGPNGTEVLNAVIGSIMGNPTVPQGVKSEINQKVKEKWSHIVDLSASPPGQGPGLGNQPGDPPPPPKIRPDLANVVAMNPADSPQNPG